MSDRLPTGLLVSALLRRVNDAGGLALVRARGDAGSGGILVVAADRDEPPRLFERALGFDGQTRLIDTTPDGGEIESYWRRRRARDCDLWVIELNIPGAERLAAESFGAN